MKNYLITSKSLFTADGLHLNRVETERQLKNGTLVFEFQTVDVRRQAGVLRLFKVKERYASYASGYVRRITNQMYPINKRKVIEVFRKVYFVDTNGNEVFDRGYVQGGGFAHHKTTLLPTEEQRLTLLANYLDKKYSNDSTIVLPKSIKTI